MRYTKESRVPRIEEDPVSTFTGEHCLLVAMIERAINDLNINLSIYNCKKKHRISAREWLDSQDDHPFSFIWCCEHLDLDHKLLLKTLCYRLEDGDLAPIVYSRRVKRR